MEEYKIKANEKFYTNVIAMLHDGGVYGWKDHPRLLFVKKDNRLVCSKEAYDMVKEIVSEEFLTKTFKIKKL